MDGWICPRCQALMWVLSGPCFSVPHPATGGGGFVLSSTSCLCVMSISQLTPNLLRAVRWLPEGTCWNMSTYRGVLGSPRGHSCRGRPLASLHDSLAHPPSFPGRVPVPGKIWAEVFRVQTWKSAVGFGQPLRGTFMVNFAVKNESFPTLPKPEPVSRGGDRSQPTP